MNPLTYLASAIVIFICILANRVSRKIGVPSLLLFIAVGIAFGSDGIVKIPFDDYVLAERICSFALLFVIFYGGFMTRWSAARPVAVKAVLLSSLGTVATAALTAVFCRLALGMSTLESLLLGSVLGSTDAASVFFILRSKKLNLKDGTASLLEMESGSNDPFAYMMTVVVLSAMNGSFKIGSVFALLASQLIFGVVAGLLIGIAAAKILDGKAYRNEGFDTIFVFGVALLAYALPSALGGNGYLSAYIAGIILGNQRLENRKNLVAFFDTMTGLMQMLLFFLLGLLAFPSRMKPVILPAIAVALFLTFVARPAATALLLSPFGIKPGQYAVVSWAGLRGAASIVFAITAMNHVKEPIYDIFHIVFGVVLFSVLFQGSLLPPVARLSKMIGADSDVMRTFSDYTDERKVQFVPVAVGDGHPWTNRKISEIELLPRTLIALLLRDGKTIVPHGETILIPGDTAFLCAEGMSEVPDVFLEEFRVTPDHRWRGKKLSRAHIPKNMIVIMVKREGEVIIPDGNTCLRENDLVVVYKKKAPEKTAQRVSESK